MIDIASLDQTDSEQFLEELSKLYPELFEKSKISRIDVQAGWWRIIHVLINSIYAPVTDAQYAHRASIEFPRDDGGAYNERTAKEVQKAIDELPNIAVIKEKFGALRAYAYNGTDRVYNLIEFAEEMSKHTCEICGKPGKMIAQGWYRVRCGEHIEREESDQEDGAIPAHIDDDH